MNENKHEIGPHCPISLLGSDPWEPYVAMLTPLTIDDEGNEVGERQNGFVECPQCGVWWPVLEEPDMWTEDDDGVWRAEGWWGGAVCDDCGLLLVTQPRPDGTPEAYVLGKDN